MAHSTAIEIKRLTLAPTKPSDLDAAAQKLAQLATQGKVIAGTAVLGGVARGGAKLGARITDGVVKPPLEMPQEALTPEGVRVSVPNADEVPVSAPMETRGRGAGGGALVKVPDIDYKGRPYTEAQKQRITELGDDQIKGFVPEEGEAGLAAETRYGMKLKRYEHEGLEFVDQQGNHWDVVSPPSVSKSGKPAFRRDQVMSAIKNHFHKGNVILDFGRLNKADAATLKQAIEGLSGTEKRGRAIIFVRVGE